MKINTSGHDDLFYRGSVPKNLIPVEEAVGVLGPTAHPGLPLKVFLGVGRCRRL
jgi:hypothetical protein